MCSTRSRKGADKTWGGLALINGIARKSITPHASGRRVWAKLFVIPGSQQWLHADASGFSRSCKACWMRGTRQKASSTNQSSKGGWGPEWNRGTVTMASTRWQSAGQSLKGIVPHEALSTTGKQPVNFCWRKVQSAPLGNLREKATPIDFVTLLCIQHIRRSMKIKSSAHRFAMFAHIITPFARSAIDRAKEVHGYKV